MVKKLKKLPLGWKTTIFTAVVAVGIAVVGGLIKLSCEKESPPKIQKQIQQDGSGHTATVIEGDKNIIAGGDVSTGIDSEAALNTLVKTSKDLGRSEEEISRLKKKIKQIEEQLANPSLETNIVLGQSIPVPSVEAKELAALITEDDGLYAQALKAIAEGDNEKANGLLDKTQQFLDTVQKGKDEAQVKIYVARMQNASYSGRTQDALQYCDKLRILAGNDSTILNEISVVYYENAKYKKAEPFMERALKIDEASLGKDHPNVARDLNNLAMLYQATGRLKEAEVLMEHALKIDEASLGEDHPGVAIDLNNLAQLYQATDRLKEAEVLMERALKIDEASLGEDHPEVAIDLNNLAMLYKATNRLQEAEPLMERALKIDEASFGKDHPDVAIDLNHLAQLYQATGRLKEAEALMERVLEIFLQFTRRTRYPHPHMEDAVNNYANLLTQMGYGRDEINERLKRMAPEMFDPTDEHDKE